MRVQLDRDKKILLLKALKDGYIDDGIIGWFDTGNMSDTELWRELTRLEVALYPGVCIRLKEAGVCTCSCDFAIPK